MLKILKMCLLLHKQPAAVVITVASLVDSGRYVPVDSRCFARFDDMTCHILSIKKPAWAGGPRAWPKAMSSGLYTGRYVDSCLPPIKINREI